MNDGKIHLGLTYVKSSHLPHVWKEKLWTKSLRRLHVVLSIKDAEHKFPLDDTAQAPMLSMFFANKSDTLKVKLFAEKSSHDDLEIARTEVEIGSLVNPEYEACLDLVAPSQSTGVNPVITFRIRTSDYFQSNCDTIDCMQEFIRLNPSLEKTFVYVNEAVKIGAALSELDPRAKAVMGLVGLIFSKCEDFVKRHVPVCQLLEALGEVCVLIAEWDDSGFADLEKHRPRQREIYDELFRVIYRTLTVTFELSRSKHATKIREVALEWRSRLTQIVDRWKGKREEDLHIAIFQMANRVENIDKDRIIQKLPFNKEHSRSPQKQCLEDTRVDLLLRIQGWALDPVGDRTLLLYGAAGNGKSSAVNTAVKKLREGGLVVVPFFSFNRNVQNLGVSQLIPSWARTLAAYYPSYLAHLHAVDRAPGDLLESTDTETQYERLWVKGLGCLSEERPVVFTIDALDECSEPGSLFSLLRKVVTTPDLPSFVRFLFTFRPDGDIQTTIAELTADQSLLPIDIDAEESTRDDIRRFVQYRLANDRGVTMRVVTVARVVPSLSQLDTTQLLDYVIDAAQSSFQCADVLCRELVPNIHNEMPTKDVAELILVLKAGKVKSLHGTYVQVLSTHFKNADLADLFRRIMSWIFLVHFPQPLSVFRSFASVLLDDIRRPDLDLIMSRLSSLLGGVASEDTPISPLHTSLRDFLVSPELKHSFMVDVGPLAQEELAWACLRIMNSELRFNICHLPPVLAMNDDIPGLDALVARYISPGLQYACLESQYHLWLSGVQENAPRVVYGKNMEEIDLPAEFWRFLQQKFLYFLEAHSCMGTRQGGPGAILAGYRKWAIRAGLSECLLVLEDVERFEARFRDGYQLSAPQVYFAGRTFVPQQSWVAQTYFNGFLKPVTISERNEASWPSLEPLTIVVNSGVTCISFAHDSTRIASGSNDKTIRLWDAATGEQIGAPLSGHASDVTSVTFSPDGNRIASGSDDKTIRLWDAATGEQIGAPLSGHDRLVASVAFSPDGTRIASGSYDNTIRLWDAATGEQIGAPLSGHDSDVNSVVFSPDGTRIASGSDDKTIRLWDAATGEQIGAPLSGHDRLVASVAFSPDGTRIASGSYDNTIRLWDAATGEQIGAPLSGHDSEVNSVVFSPDGTRIASGSDDKTIRLWDAATGEQIGAPLSGHVSPVTSVAFSPDGTRIGSGSYDNTIRLWDAATGEQIGAPLSGHDRLVASVAFSPDGTRIASGSYENTIRLWDAATGEQIGAPLSGHDSEVNSVVFSPDGTRIASGSDDKTIRLWDAATGEQIGAPLSGHDRLVASVAFSPDGTRIASGSYDNTIRLWDAATGEQIGAPLSGHDRLVTSVAFSPDGTRIASGSDDCTIRLWDAATGEQIGAPLSGHDRPVNSAAFSPDGTRIASGSIDNTIRLWDAATGEQIGAPLSGHDSEVTSVAFSPDGTRIASGSFDNTIRLWDAATGEQIGAPLSGHDSLVTSVAFSPDGTRIASGSFDNTIRLWDAATGGQIGAPLSGHDSLVTSVAFSPAGTRIASGSDDCTIRLWDAATGEQIGAPLSGHDRPVNSAAFSPDGTRIASGSIDNTIRLWDAAAGPLCDEGKTLAPSLDCRYQFYRAGDWIHVHACDEQSTDLHFLWIPHLFRRHPFSFYPCTRVISRVPTFYPEVSYAESLVRDWTSIKPDTPAMNT
ncbi:hypothetical protein HGRIS_014986 [Hohenbuehelia grisea]|uniref:NACHT domain-containing protein n=1 Tax=Hohenbuehelia grisea TaxID=104357 RepID=A0ABR3IQM5_9AGAR